MREIKFRAKTTVKENEKHAFNNVWVEGDLIVSKGRYYIHPRANKVNVDNDVGKFIVMHEVQADTVCEYTGLKDKNGKEMYEGDIVEVTEEDEYLHLEWDEDTASFVMSGRHFELDFDSYWSYEIEVIGNIFDNPELLEGGAE